MEEEIKTEKSSALLPAMGLLGLGVGTIALVLGIFAMKKAGDVSTTMTDKVEKAAALSLEIQKLSERTDSIALQIEDLKSADKSSRENLVRQFNEVIGKLNSSIVENRDSIKELRAAVETLAKHRTAPRQTARAEAPAQTAQQPAQQQEAKSDAAEESNAEFHVIQSGDTYAKIAAKYNTTVDALIKANPDLRPSRLKIGQKVKLR